MLRREIDQESDRILTELASEFEGDLSQALAHLLQTREHLETFADQSESGHRKTNFAPPAIKPNPGTSAPAEALAGMT